MHPLMLLSSPRVLLQLATARMHPLMLLSSSRVPLQLGTARMHPLMLLSSSRVLLQQGTAPFLDALSSEAEAASPLSLGSHSAEGS